MSKNHSDNQSDHSIFEINLLFDLAEDEIRRLRSALYLGRMSFQRVEFCSSQDKPLNPPDDFQTSLDWATIAAHASINALFQYREIIEQMCSWTGSTDQKNIDLLNSSARIALTQFDKKFPKAIQLRHAVAHIAEITGDFSKNAHRARLSKSLFQKEKGLPAIFSNVFENYKLIVTRKGERLEFDILGSHFEELHKIHTDFTNMASGMSSEKP